MTFDQQFFAEKLRYVTGKTGSETLVHEGLR